MKINYVFLVAIMFSMISINACNSWDESDHGMSYRIYNGNESEPKALAGDIAHFEMVYKVGDSVIHDTRNGNNPQIFKLAEPAYEGDLMGALLLMSPGDSGVFRISADSIYGDFLPPYLERGEYVYFHLKMLKTYNESAMIKAFIEEKAYSMEQSESGLYYEILEQGSGEYAEAGQMLKADFRGSILNGDIIDDTYAEEKPYYFRLGSRHLKKGWNEAFSMLKPGAKARIILPQHIAYGEMGMPDIPPFSTLYYEIELLDITEEN